MNCLANCIIILFSIIFSASYILFTISNSLFLHISCTSLYQVIVLFDIHSAYFISPKLYSTITASLLYHINLFNLVVTLIFPINNLYVSIAIAVSSRINLIPTVFLLKYKTALENIDPNLYFIAIVTS